MHSRASLQIGSGMSSTSAEAASTSTIARNLETSTDVHIPEVHADSGTRRILTLEKLRGVSVRDGDEIDRRGLDRQELADRLVGCYLRQLLVDGIYHADPHPGNILLLEESRIELIDFGAVDASMLFSRRR